MRRADLGECLGTLTQRPKAVRLNPLTAQPFPVDENPKAVLNTGDAGSRSDYSRNLSLLPVVEASIDSDGRLAISAQACAYRPTQIGC